MTNQSKCGERESLVALVYDDCDADERRRLEAHLQACPACAEELDELRATHASMAAWPMADPSGPIVDRLGSDARPWRLVQPDKPDKNEEAAPDAVRSRRVFSVRWARAAAAVLVLGATAAIANLEIKVGSDGVVLRTGWHKPSTEGPASAAQTTATASVPFDQAQGRPWHADLAALERQLRTEFSARPLVEASARNVAVGSSRPDRSPGVSLDGQLLQRVRHLIDDSERRQQHELALRVAQVAREVEAQRRGDLTRIEQGFGRLEGMTGAEAARNREVLNYLVRVSQRQ